MEATNLNDQPEELERYIHLIGRACIENVNGKLRVTLLDANDQKLSGTEPITFVGNLVLENMHLITEFGDEEQAHQATLSNEKVYSFVRYNPAVKEHKLCMNTIPPPTGCNTVAPTPITPQV